MNRATSQLLLCYYGDDFTGSTDSMEALAASGVRTVLFLQPPTPEQLARFPDLQCFGVAGVSRSMAPEEMERELTQVFESLQSFQTPVVHYKTCSTFDSSPEVGSIGRVIDIAREMFTASPVIPLLVGAPALRRYTLFGNHFASSGQEIYRLDRHPTMSKHPVTPISEADLRVHLGCQTTSRIALLNFLELEGEFEEISARYQQKLAGKPDVILFDVLDDKRMEVAGRLIWRETARDQTFVVGSSGVEYALAAHWRASGLLDSSPATVEPTELPQQCLVVSGSCSPVTQEQIHWAINHGFRGLKIPVEELINPECAEAALARVLQEALVILAKGENLVIYTALGPEDASIGETKNFLVSHGFSSLDTGKILGSRLGKLTRELILATGIKRICFAGGDTSSYATRELGIYALEMIKPAAPGSPLCRGYSEDSRMNRLELALKGGQIGKQDFFESVFQIT